MSVDARIARGGVLGLWALFFVAVFGPGALAGTCAIAFHSIGFIDESLYLSSAGRSLNRNVAFFDGRSYR